MHRREFLRGVALAGIAARGARGLASSLAGMESSGCESKEGGAMIYRTLGRTGERVSAIGMGGFHIGQPKLTVDDSIKLVRAAIDGGINFMDNSWDYNKGQSEVRMGKALKDGYRQKVFLMTKLDSRTKEEATKQINESLQRLQTDHLDLIQHHEIIRFDDPDRIFAENGAKEAVLEAKKAGKVRYIGFTGHKDPHIHLYMLEVAAKTFKPMSKEEVAALLARTEKVAAQGEYELFKTSAHFDSTAHHPEWLGGQSPHVDKLAGPPG